jgi:hypothetical protein
MVNLWTSAEHGLCYLKVADGIIHRTEGEFVLLEHVPKSLEPLPTARLHKNFRFRLGIDSELEDPSNKLLDMETQVNWLREIGFTDVDCYWKWLELALMIGVKEGKSKK